MSSNAARVVGSILVIVACSILFYGMGCSGSSRSYTSLEEEFLDYDETEMVTFKLSGEARSDSVSSNEVAHLYVELVSRLSPTSSLNVGTFDGLGSFYFPSLRAVAESTVDVYGTLVIEGGSDSDTLNAQASFTVPDEDGETVAVTLRFD